MHYLGTYPRLAATTIVVASSNVLFFAACAVVAMLTAWRVRDMAQVRRQREMTFAVRQRTEQLEKGQLLDSSRNRILQMLVSNEPLSPVLDAIVQLTHDQIPGALPLILTRQAGNACVAGAAFEVPADWLSAITGQHAVPFEIWKQRCDFSNPGSDPAWRSFTARSHNVPACIRSLPIGGGSAPALGAILLFYPESPGDQNWEQVVCSSARIAQLALDHRRYCDEMDFQARHDSLTGLANRALFDELLECAIEKVRSGKRRLAVLYIDIDAFKQVNDRHSHRTGDLILLEAARRMQASLRPGDTVARIGGDEFNVLLPDIDDATTAEELAARLLETIRTPIAADGHELTVTASIGVAVFPDDCGENGPSSVNGDAANAVQRQADEAMYCAKNLGKNRVQAFSANFETLDGVRMEQELNHALREGWFTVHYQPKFTAADELAGLEALIRMNHPRHGQILPGRFIPIAESTGLIVPIGAWVIAEVCRQIADWRNRNLRPVVVAVNVSAIQMALSDFARSVEACLAAHAVPAHCLELEVTESLLIDSEGEECRQMQLLRSMGVFISIDDFGTGFSSLSYLHQLQIDAVKLDRSFVRTIDTDPAAQRVLRAVVGVAQGLGLDVVGEGVETVAQREELIAAGCRVMQGYFFAHPGPAETVEPFLQPDPSRTDVSDGDVGRLYEALSSVSEQRAVLMESMVRPSP